MENNQQDVLKELMQEKLLEKETKRIFQPSYFQEPTQEQKLEFEKMQLQKRLVEISKLQKDDIWQQIESQKEISKRRDALKRLEYEKKLNSDVISKFWLSNRSCNPKLK